MTIKWLGRFREVLDHIYDMAFIIEPSSGKILMANARACDTLGYSYSEITSLKLENIHPFDLASVFEFAENVRAQHGTIQDNLYCKTKGDKFFPAEVSGKFFNTDGRTFMVVTVREISQRKNQEALSGTKLRELEELVQKRTEKLENQNKLLQHEMKQRKEAERRVRHERQNLYNMLDSLPMAFHLQAPDYTVPFANKVFRERFGAPQKRKCHDLMHKSSLPCEVCTTFKVFDHGKNEVTVWEALDGRTYITVCTPFTDVDGSPLVMEMALDITDQEKAKKDAILAKEEAEKSSRAKTEFLTCMSHELRTPMNAILGFSQLLGMDREQPLSPIQKNNVQHILKAGQHLLELINEVLHLSKMEAGHISISTEDVQLNTLISEVGDLIQPMLNSKNLSFMTLSTDRTVMADRVRLKQVLLNLISNSIKYNSHGGSVSVECAKLDGQKIKISVLDTGIGIKPENLKEIFQPFQRIDSKTDTIEGTGIGLTLSLKLTELMNGTLEAQSKEGHGSCFSIILPESNNHPIKEPKPATGMDSTRSENSKNSFKVLYIEDNASNMELVASILFRQNLYFLRAPDARLGIELARSHQPDLILMDIELPGMNGFEALKIIKKEPSLTSIPVIALSANNMESDIQKGLSAGFTDYITKPIKVTPFLQKVNQYLTWIQP
ncbi:MAG: response regulator [Nitrospina sp.]|jgi:PAS domain S-box-containing protein|nr:response regulator [Nitrospina sp.]